jgi:hypothetical protein
MFAPILASVEPQAMLEYPTTDSLTVAARFDFVEVGAVSILVRFELVLFDVVRFDAGSYFSLKDFCKFFQPNPIYRVSPNRFGGKVRS